MAKSRCEVERVNTNLYVATDYVNGRWKYASTAAKAKALCPKLAKMSKVRDERKMADVHAKKQPGQVRRCARYKQKGGKRVCAQYIWGWPTP